MSTARLRASAAPATAYDLVMLDLDGVVYIGPDPVPGAAEHLAAARAQGAHLAFVTNNAARPPAVVAEHLVALGVETGAGEVVTSAQAAARLAADQAPTGAPVFLLGGDGLEVALWAEGLEPVEDPGADPVLVVSGFAPEIRWRTIMRGAMLVRDGVPWIAANTDSSVPTPDGIGPGHGVLVDMIARFSGVTPVVAGKPARPLLDETVRRVGGVRPLMVGDRLDTDMAGARAAQVAGMLVLTGVMDLPTLVAAVPAERPDHLALDLRGLLEDQPAVAPDADGAVRHEGWTVCVVDGSVRVDGRGDVQDWWRAVAVAAWAHLDAHGAVAGVAGLTPPSR
ncbi:HAD superfamily hydrolase (TIGR01450 family) [Nocardioides massiliensis]|uniref:HAD superfamily hydrolase (TIGR01450 family) n=2 Tax=Nocardioides massiliensis TaxID=1325935 RepID=A0ABT9NR49_9ACTN|nr:HAD hydrolase-like protein [Nocardioides massiliensis]MDP9822907.1 HAD superfamily hydrolase (TIGR01450 family) [Nocardioides massiliensis]